MKERSHIRAVEGENSSAQATAPETPDTSAQMDDEVLPADEVIVDDDWYVEPEPRQIAAWLVPTLAITTTMAWTAFFAWANSGEILAGGSPQQWIGWITAWAVPVLLIVALWLLFMRNSAREGQRFGDIARNLSEESARLEQRLITVNRELSLAREFLGAQTRDLDYLGRSATERLSEHADRLQSLIVNNGQQVDAIATVSGTALENMDKLRDTLPVITNSARDVSNQIGHAGLTAKEQLEELVSGFRRLNEFGTASERQVKSLRQRVDEALAAFTEQTTQLADVTEQRFATLRQDSDAFRAELDGREVEALASVRVRAALLSDELAQSHATSSAHIDGLIAAMQQRIAGLRDDAGSVSQSVRAGEDEALAAWQGQIDALRERLKATIEEVAAIDSAALASAQAKLVSLRDEAQSVDARIAMRNAQFREDIDRRRADVEAEDEAILVRLDQRLSSLDAAIAERREGQLAQMAMLAEHGDALASRIAQLGDQFDIVAGQGDMARSTLADGLDALNSKLVEGREALDGTDMAVAALTDASVRLLELIQASARHSRNDLPVAMADAENRLQGVELRSGEILAQLGQAKLAGDAVSQSLADADARCRNAMEAVDSFQSQYGETAASQVEGIEQMRAGIAALRDESTEVAERVQNELRDALAALEESSRNALVSIESEQSDQITRIADKVGEQSAAAIDRAVAEHSVQSLANLDEATQRSTATAREAATQLRDQLAKVNELTNNLESRVMRARERAEEQVDNDFSRRVALLTESLNSNAIDIAKALSTDVTDTAWKSYLRGDRGIFTRRAVRLLDNTETRAIAEIYGTDMEFREHVNRYIHDFEAMLRTMLSTRDGNAVAVTLLSSDMGKLYVVLAQAIERLRD